MVVPFDVIPEGLLEALVHTVKLKYFTRTLIFEQCVVHEINSREHFKDIAQ